MMGLRLPLVRRPDPVLTSEELRVIATLLNSHIAWAEREMDRGKVSEAIIRSHLAAESAHAKIKEALRP